MLLNAVIDAAADHFLSEYMNKDSMRRVSEKAVVEPLGAREDSLTQSIDTLTSKSLGLAIIIAEPQTFRSYIVL